MSDTPKAIGSLAKKQQDVTRQGTQKLKFVPTLPSRRKKEETKIEPSRPSVTTPDIGHNDGPGKGRGHGTQRKPVEMTASGPFAMGPASRPPAGIASPATPSTSGPNPTMPSPKPSGLVHLDHYEDEELFSEPDEGVEVIDIQSVQRLDWTAPETLRRVPHIQQIRDCTSYLQELPTQSLFSIQFPTPFPTFSPAPDLGSQDIKPPTVPIPSTSSITGTEQQPSESKAAETVDGVIGQLELYRNGTVRIRMPNGILFDMKSATQLPFQEQAVILNRADNRLIVLGETDKRYVVSPDVDALLAAMDVADRSVGVAEIEEGLIAMDTT